MTSVEPPSSEWLIDLTRDRDQGPTLVCLPFAGGNAMQFAELAKGLPGSIRVRGIQLPGRSTRLMQPPISRLPVVVDAIVAAVEGEVEPPFAFFGTSMGALLAFETTRALRRRGSPLPTTLFAVTARAPQLGSRNRGIHQLPDDELTAALHRYGGTPQAVLDEPELMELLLPMIRADFTLTETYRYEDEPALDVPIVAIGGASDPTVSVADLAAWSAQTAAAYRQHVFAGDHFFYREPDRLREIIGLIADLITEDVLRERGAGEADGTRARPVDVGDR